MKKSIKKLAIASMIVMVMSSGIVNANESESKTKKHPREYLTLKIDSNAKTGGFFGGELGLGIYVGKQLQWYAPGYGYPNDIVNFSEVSNPHGFRINLIGGYQWYFYNHPNFSLGVRAKGYLGYGHYKYSVKDNGNNYHHMNYNEFNIGSELQFLWDFLNIDKHSLGIHFSPIGFDVNVTVDNTRTDASKTTNNDKNRENTDVFTTPSYTISTGIHYYYDANHQLFLDYKYLSNGYDHQYNYLSILKHLFTIGYSYKF